MLMFLAVLGVSVAATFLVELLDIECIRQARGGMHWRLGEGKRAEAPFRNPVIFASLR